VRQFRSSAGNSQQWHGKRLMAFAALEMVVQAVWRARRFLGVLVRSAEVMDIIRILDRWTQLPVLPGLFPMTPFHRMAASFPMNW
jgi:hypothetical protein